MSLERRDKPLSHNRKPEPAQLLRVQTRAPAGNPGGLQTIQARTRPGDVAK